MSTARRAPAELSATARQGSGAGVECISAGGHVLAIAISKDAGGFDRRFLTAPEEEFQLGLLHFDSGHVVAQHAHQPVGRRLDRTSEVLVVRCGRCEIDIFDDDDRPVATRRLATGDAIILLRGGHGLRMLTPVDLLEVKQGPYHGVGEKRLF